MGDTVRNHSDSPPTMAAVFTQKAIIIPPVTKGFLCFTLSEGIRKELRPIRNETRYGHCHLHHLCNTKHVHTSSRIGTYREAAFQNVLRMRSPNHLGY